MLSSLVAHAAQTPTIGKCVKRASKPVARPTASRTSAATAASSVTQRPQPRRRYQAR